MRATSALRAALVCLGLTVGTGVAAQEIIFRDGFEAKPFVLNEIESSDSGGVDWIEFRNTTDASVDVSGWLFTDSDPLNAYVFPNGTTVPAGGYLVVDENAFGFALGATDSVAVYDKDEQLVDRYDWLAHATFTYGRCPDGTGPFTQTDSATLGTANDCPAGPAGAIVINEIESNPDDWVEFHNRGAGAVDISGWTFRDSDPLHAYTFSPGTIVPAGGYIYRLGGVVDFDFGLGAADSMNLYSPQGLVDSYSWTSHAAGTYARCPDGSGAFIDVAVPTQGTSNAPSCP